MEAAHKGARRNVLRLPPVISPSLLTPNAHNLIDWISRDFARISILLDSRACPTSPSSEVSASSCPRDLIPRPRSSSSPSSLPSPFRPLPGGPAGLVALKTLNENGFEPILFESEDEIGGTFRYRGYENADLVSSKQLTTFSDFRFPLSNPDHVSLPEYSAYLDRYVEHFKLRSRINTGTRVVSVKRIKAEEGKGHLIEVKRNGSSETELISVRYLCICTGLHVLPQVPQIPGIVRRLSLRRVLASSPFPDLFFLLSNTSPRIPISKSCTPPRTRRPLNSRTSRS